MNQKFNLAFPLPVIDSIVSRFVNGDTILAHPFVILVAVEVTTDTAMLATNRRSRHNLNEMSISAHPDTQEGVHIDSLAPLEDLEDVDAVFSVFLFLLILEGFGASIDFDVTVFTNVNNMTTKVGLDGKLVANLLLEDSVRGSGSTVARDKGPA